MPTANNFNFPLRCVLLAPFNRELHDVRRAVERAADESSVRFFSAGDTQGSEAAATALPKILAANLLIAVASRSRDTNVFYEVGLAHGIGKPVIFLIDEEDMTLPLAARFGQTLLYTRSPDGLKKLQRALRKLFAEFRHNPERFQSFPKPPTRQLMTPVVDLDRIEPREFENLCFELLTQMGFKRVEWGKEIEGIDAVATLPKKDPDGFEYNELWLISMGLEFPSEILLEMAIHDRERFMHRLLRPGVIERLWTQAKPDTPVTLLLIFFRDSPLSEAAQRDLRRMEQRYAERQYPLTLRFRFWDRQQLVSLIQRYPQIALKYFSEEGRAQSKYRKSPDELYRENVELTERLQEVNNKLQSSTTALQRAERDAVWKDVAFTAAHKLGNPIFALETNLQVMKKQISGSPSEASEIAKEMADSIEKAKSIIEQFKSLTRAREISPRPVDLVPLIESASRVARENGVQVQLPQNGKHPQALADPARITECFDELFANALHWLEKPEKRIVVTVDVPPKKELPPTLDETRSYVRIRFKDNGCGVALDKKEQIFAPFYTTYPHGTGLGLSLVQKVVEGHGGVIREHGKPDEGAAFELLLPSAPQNKGS
jgi:signal transduction histidine kinase